MSKLFDKAREMKRRGEAKRRDWSPKPDSWMLRWYQWWLKETGEFIPRENFCHFWRVVLIWAPLRRLKKPLLGLLVLAMAAGVTWLVMLFTDTALAILVGAVSIAYIIFGLCAAYQLTEDLDLGIDPEGPWWLSERSSTVRGLVYFLTLPVLIVIVVIVLVIGSLVMILNGLHRDYNLYDRVWSWLVGTKLSENIWIAWLRPWQMIPVALLVLSEWYDWASMALVVVLTIAAFCLAIDVAARLEAQREERARLEREAQRRRASEAEERLQRQLVDRVVRIIFEVAHPKWTESEFRWNCWQERYAKWLYRDHGYESIYAVDAYCHIDLIRRSSTYTKVLHAFRRPREVQHCEAVEQDQASLLPKSPGRFKKSLEAIEGFFVLIWAIILTKKWGICPWVEIPTERREL